MNPQAVEPAESARAIYLKGLREASLLYQFDRVAGVPVFYPREVGPSGVRGALEWRRSGGRGTVYSITVIHRKDEGPYNIALIALDEGFRMMSTVISATPVQVRIGQAVQAAFDEFAGAARVVFRPI